MKKFIASLIAVAALSGTAMAEQVTCHNTKSGERMLYIADDMGSITTGTIIIGKNVLDVTNEKPNVYKYHYGKFLRALQYTNIGTVKVDLRSIGDDDMVGTISVKDNSNKITYFQVFCNE